MTTVINCRVLGSMAVLVTSGIMGCTRPEPGRGTLYDACIRLVMQDASRTSGSVIVLDQDNLDGLPTPLRAKLKTALLQRFQRVLVFKLHGDPGNLPGAWEDAEEGSALRINVDHRLLLVTLKGEHGRWTLEWDFLCGRVCGFGRSARLKWNGIEWKVDKDEVFRFY